MRTAIATAALVLGLALPASAGEPVLPVHIGCQQDGDTTVIVRGDLLDAYGSVSVKSSPPPHLKRWTIRTDRTVKVVYRVSRERWWLNPAASVSFYEGGEHSAIIATETYLVPSCV